MSPGVRVGVILDRLLMDTRIPRLVEEFLRETGYKPVMLELEESDDKPSPPILSQYRENPVMLLAFHNRAAPKWLQHTEISVLFPHSIVIIVAGKDNPSLPSLNERYRYVTTYELSDLTELVLSLARLLRSAKEELTRDPLSYVSPSKRTTEMREPYEVLSVRKEVTISPSGHGYIETSHAIRVLEDFFGGTSHYFGLNEYTPPSVKLPPLRELMQKPLEARFSSGSFSYRLLSPLDTEIYMAVVEIEHESEDRTKVFRFLFSPKVEKGKILRFAWSWSHPQIFNPHGKDASTLKCSRRYGEVHLLFTFLRESGETNLPFADGGEPVLEISNPVGVGLGTVTPRREHFLHGVRYTWSLFGVKSSTTLSAHWRLR